MSKQKKDKFPPFCACLKTFSEIMESKYLKDPDSDLLTEICELIRKRGVVKDPRMIDMVKNEEFLISVILENYPVGHPVRNLVNSWSNLKEEEINEKKLKKKNRRPKNRISHKKPS